MLKACLVFALEATDMMIRALFLIVLVLVLPLDYVVC